MIIYSDKEHCICNLEQAAIIKYGDSIYASDCINIYSADCKRIFSWPAKPEEAARFISRISEAWGKLDRICIDDYISDIEEEEFEE